MRKSIFSKNIREAMASPKFDSTVGPGPARGLMRMAGNVQQRLAPLMQRRADQRQGATPSFTPTPGLATMKKGGKVKKSDAAAAVHNHERAMHKGKPLTKLAKGGAAKRADGCAKKGHTKGKMV
jgi:hypothetical protein